MTRAVSRTNEMSLPPPPKKYYQAMLHVNVNCWQCLNFDSKLRLLQTYLKKKKTQYFKHK